MSRFSEEEVMAFADGRLTGSARQAIEEQLKVDPDLARKIAAQRWMARQVVAAFDEPPHVEFDQGLMARLGLLDGNVVAIGSRRQIAIRRSVFGAILTGAAAACLALGFFGERILKGSTATMLGVDTAGHMVARGELADSLSNQLAAGPGKVRIGVTVQTAEGICRTFSTRAGLSGMACRNSDGWTVPIVVASAPQASVRSEYHLASDTVAPAVMDEVDRRMIGEPLSPAEENTLRSNDWLARK
ncbi:MAG: hypothetical protein KGP14_15610, partial [Betaproteobacteria bacterium]|nr:hypothetical protein [Betaproteobacteria bacterium]